MKYIKNRSGSAFLGFALVGVFALSAAAACSKAPPEKVSEVRPAPSAKAVSSGPSLAPRPEPTPSPALGQTRDPIIDLKISWELPKGWASVAPESPMQKARLLVPPAGGDKEGATITVFYFGPDQGGSVDANIDRWVGQFKDVDPKSVVKSERAAAGLTAHLVEVPSGTFDSMMPGMPSSGPKKDFALQGAILEAKSGKYFFKMIGPKKTVAERKAEFLVFLDSLKEKP